MRRGLLLNLALSLGVTVALVVALEGGARLVEKRRPPSPPVADYIWDWDEKMPGGFYLMKSDAVGWPPWEEFNGDGLRDRTRPHEKPEGVRRVAVLGDSVTLGAEIRPDQAYPQLLEARLRASGRPLEVMNVALWGWSTRQERLAWRRIARTYRPDAAILAVCLNDIPELFNNLERPPRWLAALHERSSLARLVVNAQGREIDSVERLFTDPAAPRVRQALARFFDEVRALRREVEADGASLSLIVFPFRFQLEHGAPPAVVQRQVAAFCRSEGLRCLDLLPALAPLGPSAFVDYDHLSPAGASATGDALLRSGLLPDADSARTVLERALGALGDRAARAGRTAALDWVRHEERALRTEGARALAALLSARGASVRLAAAWALQRAGAPALPGREPLAHALRADTSTGVRAAAAGALGAIGASARVPVPELFEALEDPSEAVRHAAASALAGLPAGAGDLGRFERALASTDDYVCAFAAWSLGNLGGRARDAVAALVTALARPRTEAVVSGALARIGPAAAAAVPALVESLRSPNADRRWRAARTLGRIGAPAEAALGPLTAALRDENGAVRQHAARALGRLGVAALPAAAELQRATGDPDEAVRREARGALERLH